MVFCEYGGNVAMPTSVDLLKDLNCSENSQVSFMNTCVTQSFTILLASVFSNTLVLK